MWQPLRDGSAAVSLDNSGPGAMPQNQPLMEGPNERLEKTLKLVVGFFAGCVAGAAAVSWLGDWAWSLPVVLAAAAVAVR